MSGLKIVPLGGMGKVTQNMFLYQYEDEILIVDCGIGFPDMYMPGVDILIPDIKYLLDQLEQGKQIVGMVLSHGHDDHIGATPYILPELPEFPIFGSELTIAFAQDRMSESNLDRKMLVLNDKRWFKIGQYFAVMPLHMTHSVPDTKHYLIRTPEGIVYHGSDFKLDRDPVDGLLSEYKEAPALAGEKIKLLLMDCLRVEKSEWVKSESKAGPVIEEAMMEVKGKVVVTLMSSHIHRIQQVVDASEKLHRKITFVGRSVERNVEAALSLKKLEIPRVMLIDKESISEYPDHELTIVIAGSQGQEGSSLIRAIYGEHRIISIKNQDRVLFSADAIPGNEIPYFEAIDELFRNGIQVIYPSIEPEIHQSGHASAPEQQELLKTIQPEYVMPIGGADRHRYLFKEKVAAVVGFDPKKVLVPEHGQILELKNGFISFPEQITIQSRAVDGLGIGDVGPKVLSDRKILGNAGMIVLVLPRFKQTGEFDLKNVKVVSRGFVFMQEADEVIKFLKDQTAEFLASRDYKWKETQIRGRLERRISKKLFKMIQREPLVLSVILDI